MKYWILLIAGAMGPFLFASTLPNAVVFATLPLLALMACVPAARHWCLLPAFFLFTTCTINERLSDRLPVEASGRVAEIEGTVIGLPETKGERLRFVFEPDKPGNNIPKRINVNWYEDRFGTGASLPRVRAGERWRLRLDLRAPRGTVNFHGPDSERWHFANGLGARALVKDGGNELLAGPRFFDLHHWRERVLGRMYQVAGDAPAFRVLAALAVADRRGLLKADRAMLSATGTGHLLAISGLHIGLASALGFWLGRLVLVVSPFGFKHRGAVLMPWAVAWFSALSYAAMAGFGVSTQRALIMLSVATAVLLTRRKVHPFQGWLVAMALVLVADPFAPLRAGFWFSFTAVAVLLLLFVPRQGGMAWWRRMLLAQGGISLVMAPLGMYWFQQASLPGFIANLVAIPVVSVVVVPQVLLALPLLWVPGSLAAWLLTGAGYATSATLLFLEQVSQLQPGWIAVTHAPGIIVVLVAMVGGAVLTLPRGVTWRYLGLLLIAPLLLPAHAQLEPGVTRVDVLDVGQGLAVLLTGQDLQLLYDTGPGNGLTGEARWDTVDGVIRPAITASGRRPGLIVASHADLDHSGGLQRLLQIYPEARYLGSFPEAMPTVEPCHSPRNWRVGAYTLTLLHPSIGLPYLGNASSCVLSVRGAGFSLFLGGDIDATVERRLAGLGLGPHQLLVAPHHGSSTSSSQYLLDAVRPALALVSAGAENRFGQPHAEVLARFARAGVPVLNTALCGGVRVSVAEDGSIRTDFARVAREAVWRFPADAMQCSAAGVML